MPRYKLHTIRCDCCYGVAGNDPQWTKLLFNAWLCDECYDKVFKRMRKHGHKADSLHQFDEWKELTNLVGGEMDQIYKIKLVRAANIIRHGPIEWKTLYSNRHKEWTTNGESCHD